MAIGTTSLFSSLSGSLSQIDFRTRKNKKIEIGKKRIPLNTRSPRQLEVRAGYGRLHELWQNASYIDKNPIISNAEIECISSWNQWLKNHLPTMCWNPAFYWPAVEGSGTSLHNLTPNTANGTISGMAWILEPSNIYSLYSDGLNDQVEISDNPLHTLSTEMTIKSWIYPRPQTADYMRLIEKGGWASGGYSIQQSTTGNNQILCALGSNVGWSGATSIPIDYTDYEWFMLTFTIKDSEKISTYKNGDLIGTIATPPIFTTSNKLRFGNLWATSFKGSYASPVIDTKVWDSAIISNIFNLEKSLFNS